MEFIISSNLVAFSFKDCLVVAISGFGSTPTNNGASKRTNDSGGVTEIAGTSISIVLTSFLYCDELEVSNVNKILF